MDIGFNLLMPDRSRGQKSIEKFKVSGKDVYTGKCSVNFSTFGECENMALLKSRPWLIAHPDCEGKIYRATAIETYRLGTSCYTLPVGVVVEEIISDEV